jgi:threonylcarbamoyladenosine tRNA methylthiotransferase MtaB
MKAKKIAFHTLGCKLNFSETSTIGRSLITDGFEQVGFSDQADIFVINSCSVTKNAEKRCKALIRQIIKRNPAAFVAVVGCYSQINPEELKNTPGVGLVLGNAEKFNLFEHLKRLQPDAEPSEMLKMNGHTSNRGKDNHQQTDALETFIPSWSRDDRTRSFFKIQDGCDYFCAYCTIPLARGHSRSDTIAGTIMTAREIARTDVKEIVLSGVNIGDFGKTHNERFIDLLKELVRVDGIERIRISSLEPDLLDNEIIRLVGDNPKLMPHFHIPLQSGCDKVLQAMGRRYNTATFANRIDTIRQYVPDACIAADLIVGFPAESDARFETSHKFLKEADISYMHVFTYSERDHTRASSFDGHIPTSERHQRSVIMHELSEMKKHIFYKKNKEKEALILWENTNQNGWMYGFTENYIRCKTTFRKDHINQIQKAILKTPGKDGVFLV